MNSRKSIYDTSTFYITGTIHKASYRGMRYMIKPEVKKVDGVMKGISLEAYVWPEPFCFEKTDEDKIIYRKWGFSEKDLDEIYDWICENYEKYKDQWEKVYNDPLGGIDFAAYKEKL